MFYGSNSNTEGNNTKIFRFLGPVLEKSVVCLDSVSFHCPLEDFSERVKQQRVSAEWMWQKKKSFCWVYFLKQRVNGWVSTLHFSLSLFLCLILFSPEFVSSVSSWFSLLGSDIDLCKIIIFIQISFIFPRGGKTF